jgi:dipeptidyl aminopeptidase/acylaminoacyl peptidase
MFKISEAGDSVRQLASGSYEDLRKMSISDMEEVSARIKIGAIFIQGDLVIPNDPKGVILFAHGSGSSRYSPRNRYVAKVLNQRGFATFLIDLLTEDEEAKDFTTADLRFDIPLLADRLLHVIDWLGKYETTQELNIGLFGASTGAAAALVAASQRADSVKAVVSRGGRPDLAYDALSSVHVPTLLIVGEHDFEVLELNETALSSLRSQEKKLEIVPRATHLFEEPGALEAVAKLAARWFELYLGKTKLYKKRV